VSVLSLGHRRAVRQHINPYDKSSVVSIYPRKIDEKKHTIQPGRFIIEPGSYEKPSILVVGSSSWWREIDEDQPLLEIPCPSVQVADAIVKDFCNGLHGCNMVDAMPGLFWIPGEFDVVSLKTQHKVLLDKAAAKQKNYYEVLVKEADKLWARSNGNPLVISDDMRLAARELGIHEGKVWMKDHTLVHDRVQCKACGSFKDPKYPVCKECGYADAIELAALGLVKTTVTSAPVEGNSQSPKKE